MSSELIKINTSTYSRKLDEILENRTEVYLKAKLTKRLTYGEYVGEPKNGFELVLGDTVKILSLDNVEVFEQPISPSLTDDQQVVLEWLKQYREEQGENPLNTVFTIIEMYSVEPSYDGVVPLPVKVKEAYKNLNDEQEFQVLAAFAEWGLSTLDN